MLGPTGRRVSAIGLGARPLAAPGRPPEREALRVIHAALDLGVSWIDVADAYALDEDDFGYCERLVRRAIATWSGGREEPLVIAKGGYLRVGARYQLDCRPSRVRAACHATLKALGASSLFLYQLHGPDPHVFFPDTIGALAELRKEGKIQHIGLCNVDVGHLKDAAKIAPIATVQNGLNVCDRHSLANGVLDWCVRNHAAFIAHSPVGGHWGHQRIANHPELLELAVKYGASPHEIALAWLLSLSDCILAIPGASRRSSIASSVRASQLRLADADLKDLKRRFARPNALVRHVVQARRQLRHVVRNVRTRTTQPPDTPLSSLDGDRAESPLFTLLRLYNRAR
jgi:aryl-alcohol dehydrogenase-like predicted oxidoreductase